MKLYLLTLFCLFLTFVSFTQSNNHKLVDSSTFEPISETLNAASIFDSDNSLGITLKYDITSFIRRKSKGEYLDAELRIHLSETDSIVKDIRLKARGNFRRGHCFFPPIYLNFKTDPINNTDLKGIKKIKLVTHCSSVKAYENYVLKEYLAYKIYNVLSDNSFRVKLLDIEYVDTGKKQRHYKQHGFLIEPIELLAKRTNAIEIDSEIVSGKNIFEYEADVVSLFNYLIGNTDWRFKGGHNMKYLKSYENLSTLVVPVPYDFDYAGFVGTSYAVPQEWTNLESVRERQYLGYCRSKDEQYLKVIDLFVQKKMEILNEIRTFPHFDEKERNRMVAYLEEFYQLAKKPKNLMSIVKRECRDADF